VFIVCFTVLVLQGCVNDKVVEVQSKSGTVVNVSSEVEEVVMQNTRRMERTRTPATVAEPDSTISNEVGDQVIPAEVELAESHAMVDSAADDRSGTEMARQPLNDDDGDVMSSNCDATNSGCRNFRDKSSLEKHWKIDARRSGNRLETVTTLDVSEAEDTECVETSSSETRTKRKMSEKKTESVLGRLAGLISRKRQCTDVVDVDGSTQAPSSALDTVKKKRRPDPLILSASSAEHYGYPSWLRSPRVWRGSGAIPYTPPPMLSPARRAPGLFWTAAKAQNQPLWPMFRPPPAFTCEFVLWKH